MKTISVPAFVFDLHESCQYYLIRIEGDQADADGCHGDESGVVKAKRLIESLNCIRKSPGRRYVMIRVQEVPELDVEINQESVDVLSHEPSAKADGS